MMTFIDQMGHEVLLKDFPKRIVSLVPSQTELLFDLGLRDEVVGITKFCVHPTGWFETKTRIGGTKKIDITRVEELKPDLIIANKEENTREDIELLKQIAPVWISNIIDFNDALDMIKLIGMLVNKEKEANLMRTEILHSFVESEKIANGKSAVYFIWKNPYMCAGKDTFIDAMMTKIGIKNLVLDFRYPCMDLPVNNIQPDLVMLSSEPYPFNEKDIIDMKRYFPTAKVMLVDGEFFSWYGSRMRYAINYFRLAFNSSISESK